MKHMHSPELRTVLSAVIVAIMVVRPQVLFSSRARLVITVSAPLVRGVKVK
jgi:hypothetical protein